MDTSVNIENEQRSRETFTRDEILERRGVYVKERDLKSTGGVKSSANRFVTIGSAFGSTLVTLFVNPSGTVEKMNEKLHNNKFVEVSEDVYVTFSNS